MKFSYQFSFGFRSRALLWSHLFLLLFLSQFGQTQCFVDYSSSSTASMADCDRYFDEDMAYAYTQGVIYLNFHFILNSNGEGNFLPDGDNNHLANDDNINGLQIALDILDRLNELTEELIEAPDMVSPVGSDLPSVRRMPWRFELYTEGNNMDDEFGGIWFWNHSNYGNDLLETHGPNINDDLIIQYAEGQNSPAYGNKVIDIYMVEIDGTGQGGWAPETSIIGRGIFLFNTWKAYNEKMAISANSNHWYQGFVLNHEIGHILTGSGHASEGNYFCSDAATLWANSNNVMCAAVLPWRTAWTQCQVNTMYQRFQNSPNRLYYIPTDPCEFNSSETYIVEGDEIFDTQITFDRNIEIEENASLTVQCLLNMPSYGKIKIKPGGRLILDAGTITSGCQGEQWFGIQVFGNVQNQSGNLQGTFISNANSVLKNAIIAISNPNIALYNSLLPFSGGGGNLVITHTTFLNNSVSISLYPYKFGNQSGTIVFKYPAAIDDSRFITNDDYIDNVFKYPIQIQALGVNGPTIRNTSFINERTDVDELAYLGIGIFSYGSGFTTSGHPTIDRPVFKGYQYGIAAFGGFNDFVYSINNNDFKENVVGVTSMGVDKFIIQNCDFEVGGLDMPYNVDGNDIHEGVSVLTGSTFTIRNNEFYAADNTPIPPVLPGDFFDPVKFGLRILNSGQASTTVKNNTFTDLYIANKAEGLNRSVSENEIGLFYRCNENNNFNYDFIVQKINSEDGILFNQGSSEDPAKNTFTQLENLFGSDFINGSDWPIQYWWYEHIPSHEPIHYYSDKNFIKRNEQVLGVACGLIGHSNFGFTNIGSLKGEFHLQSSQYDSLNSIRNDLIDEAATSNWLSRLNNATLSTKSTFLNQLAQLSPYTSETLIDSILGKTSLFTLQEIISILEQNSHFYLSADLKAKATNLWNISDSLMGNIFTSFNSDLLRLDSKISNAASRRASSLAEILFHFASDSLMRDSIEHWLTKLENIEYSYMLVDQALSMDDWIEAEVILDEIHNSFDLDPRMEGIHSDYLDWIELSEDMVQNQDNFIAWIDSNYTSLVSIAENSISKPAANARGLLRIQNPEYDFYWPALDVEDVIKPRSIEITSSQLNFEELQVFPNPAENVIYFKYPVSDKEITFINIYDINGICLLHYKLFPGNVHIIDINELSHGMYYVTIGISSSKRVVSKFIKIK